MTAEVHGCWHGQKVRSSGMTTNGGIFSVERKVTFAAMLTVLISVPVWSGNFKALQKRRTELWK